MKSWYAVHAKARQEAVAKEHLERQGFHVYTPRIRNARRRRGKWCSVIEPLFPGYLFAELDIDAQNVAPIRSTRGVIGLVRFGGELCTVPTHVVETLIRSQEHRDTPIEPAEVFKRGDEVTIVDGPFAGVNAIFQAATAEERVLLLLDLLGRSNQLVVPPHQIVPAI